MHLATKLALGCNQPTNHKVVNEFTEKTNQRLSIVNNSPPSTQPQRTSQLQRTLEGDALNQFAIVLSHFMILSTILLQSSSFGKAVYYFVISSVILEVPSVILLHLCSTQC
jgi:hypothetical protein